jgi:glycyl-tRNA synthetase beta subunit
MTVFKRKFKDMYEIIELIETAVRKENEATVYRRIKHIEKNLRKARRLKNLELVWAVLTNIDEHIKSYIEAVEHILDGDNE